MIVAVQYRLVVLHTQVLLELVDLVPNLDGYNLFDAGLLFLLEDLTLVRVVSIKLVRNAQRASKFVFQSVLNILHSILNVRLFSEPVFLFLLRLQFFFILCGLFSA